MLYCAAIGCVLAVLIAGTLSRSPRQSGAGSSVIPRAVLAAVPFYLAANYLAYQEAAMIAGAGIGCVGGLYVLRGWWLPDWSTVVGKLGRRRRGAALRYRMLAVVGDDRAAGGRSLPNAA